MIIKRDIYYPPAGSSRRLHIYLPDDYHKSEERYPVMYFFDGHNLFFNEDATYGKSWGFKEFLEGWNRKMIIVGMECSHEGNSRLIEYFPYELLSDISAFVKAAYDVRKRIQYAVFSEVTVNDQF